MWGSPSFPMLTHSYSYVFTSILTVGTDALPLFWEFYSGDGVICGASMHYDWNSFIYVPILLEAVALLPINCTLSLNMTSHTCIQVYMKFFMRPNIQREVESGQRQGRLSDYTFVV